MGNDARLITHVQQAAHSFASVLAVVKGAPVHVHTDKFIGKLRIKIARDLFCIFQGLFAVVEGMRRGIEPFVPLERRRLLLGPAEGELKTARAELADQRGRVEQDVRTALIELETTMGQVRLAETNRPYAGENLAEARDRFGAGVATTVEVVQAQEQVAKAEVDYISSLFSFDLAKLSLARASGEAEATLSQLLGGGQQ